MGWEIRQATESDISVISQIHAQTWKSAYKGIVPQRFLDGLRADTWVPAFKNWFELEVFKVALLLEDADAVGCITYGASRDNDFPHWAEIVSLYVLPQVQGKGYGRLLMGTALSQFKTRRFNHCFLWVLKDNLKARSFYERMGFSQCGEESEVVFVGQALADLRYVCSLK